VVQRVTLTIDNGPTPGVTDAVLDVLGHHGVAAVFFVVGRQAATPLGKRLVERAVGEGHLVGSHTWSHTRTFGDADDATVDDELDRGRQAVHAAGGDPLLFRPYGAGGVIDERLMSPHGATRLIEDGCTCVLWTSVPGDWRDPMGWPDVAVTDIEAVPWPVVVVHDVADAALARLDDFLTGIDDRGVVFTTDVPDACTPIRAGVPTSSWELLGVGPPAP
jgi:peptidoglycan/xylan/chitin deacetylase (PgdA/CDA1 family)